MAERHVLDSARHIASQREIVGTLEARGGDARLAHVLLATFEQSAALHVRDRDRLREMKMYAEKVALHRMLIKVRLSRLRAHRAAKENGPKGV